MKNDYYVIAKRNNKYVIFNKKEMTKDEASKLYDELKKSKKFGNTTLSYLIEE